MKAAGPNTLAALQSGQFYKAELYDLALQSGLTLRFTDYDLPLVYNGNTYASNVVAKRGTITQKIGFSVDTLSLNLAPQPDAPVPLVVGSLSIMQAARLGYFDAAALTMHKVFMQAQTGGMLPTNTNNEAVLWWTGIVSQADVSRQSVNMSVVSNLQQLNVQMPRNLIQTGCTHTLFDSGCTLVKATYTVSGTVTVTGPNSVNGFSSNLTAADAYYSLGVVTFTSGANNGLSYTVGAYLNANGIVTPITPFTNQPATGDTFTIIPGCDKTLNSCQTKFLANNQTHFRGAPWVPVPETLYDGGTIAGPAPTLGGQGGPGTGSRFLGGLRGIYKP